MPKSLGGDASLASNKTRGAAAIRASTDPPSRQALKIARREQFVVKTRRMMATSWFDIAVAYYNLARKPEARQFAQKVVDDEQFGERAREMLLRLR